MIKLNGLEKRYGPKVLLKSVDFHLRPGDRVGLIGENGMGKTTLFRILTHKESYDGGTVSLRKGARIAMLEQELKDEGGTVLERVVLGDDHFRKVKEGLEQLQNDTKAQEQDSEAWAQRYGNLQHEFERMGGYHREATAQTILAGLAFKTDQMNQPLSEFSGGWRMRVELARLLLQQPEVLLLDEPTNHLDLASVVWLESFLKSYEGSLLLISHDRRFLNNLVTRIAELDRGNLTLYSGNYDDFERLKAERAEQLESQAANQQRRVAELERFIERFRAKNTKAAQAKSKQKILDKMEKVETTSNSRTVKFRFPQPARIGRIALDLVNITKSYGDLTVYQDFSIQLERGSKVALVGVNGAGKSTLMKLMAGVLQPNKGEVVEGHNVTRAYFAQHNMETLKKESTVIESLDEVAGSMMLTRKRSILGAFLFGGDDVEKKVSVLSGGEKARLALARLLVHPAPLLLVDEPTNHLDIRSCEVLAAALADFDGTLVAISHDRFFLDGIINQVWEVEAGKVRIYHGNYTDYEREKAKQAAAQSKIDKQAREANSSKAKQDKQRKRREAEERNNRHRKLKPLKKRLQEIEPQLEKVLKDKEEVETRLGAPDIYDSEKKADLNSLLEKQGKLAKEEQKLTQEWDKLIAEIEPLEATS